MPPAKFSPLSGLRNIRWHGLSALPSDTTAILTVATLTAHYCKTLSSGQRAKRSHWKISRDETCHRSWSSFAIEAWDKTQLNNRLGPVSLNGNITGRYL